MSKKLAIIFSLLMTVMLAACGSTEVTEKEGTVSSGDTPAEETGNQEESNATEEKVNQLIADDENIKATLVGIVEKKDDIWGNSIEVTFEVENKTDKTIEVQADEVSADNKMVDEALCSMSTEISPGKLADCVLTISDYEGHTFPTLEENLEMKLKE